MSHTLLINIARVISILGLGLLTFSAIGGTLLASRTAQKIKFLKGQTFKYHRTLSIIGTVMLLIHPIPLWLASKTTGVTLASIFVPFLANKQSLWVAFGTLAMYAMIVVTATSIYIKRIKRRTWRAAHYVTYAFFTLGLVHAIPISNDFGKGAHVNYLDFEKILFYLAAVAVLAFPVWRVIAARQQAAKRLAKVNLNSGD